MASLSKTGGVIDLDGSGAPVTSGAFYGDLWSDPAAVSGYLPAGGSADSVEDVVGSNDGGELGTGVTYTDGLYGRAIVGDGRGGVIMPAAAGGSADTRTMLFRIRPDSIAVSFGRTVWQDNTSTERQWRNTLHTGGVFYSQVFDDSNSVIANELTSLSISVGQWATFIRKAGPSTSTMRTNGVVASAVTYTGNGTLKDSAYDLGVLRGEVANTGAVAAIAELLILDRLTTDDEDAAYEAGPPPTVSQVSLGADGLGQIAATSNNGDISYTWLLQRKVGSSWVSELQIDSTNNSGQRFSLTYGQIYRLWGIAENDAGIAKPIVSAETIAFTDVYVYNQNASNGLINGLAKYENRFDDRTDAALTIESFDYLDASANTAASGLFEGSGVLAFPSSGTNSAVFVSKTPIEYESRPLEALVSWTTASETGNVSWSLDLQNLNSGDATIANYSNAATGTFASEGSGIINTNLIQISEFDMQGLEPRQTYSLRVQRLGDDAADTLDDVANLLKVEVREQPV